MNFDLYLIPYTKINLRWGETKYEVQNHKASRRIHRRIYLWPECHQVSLKQDTQSSNPQKGKHINCTSSKIPSHQKKKIKELEKLTKLRSIPQIEKKHIQYTYLTFWIIYRMH